MGPECEETSTTGDGGGDGDGDGDGALPFPVLHYAFDGDLTDSAGMADGVAVGNLTYGAGLADMAVRFGDPGSRVDMSAFGPDYLMLLDGVTVYMQIYPEQYIDQHVFVGLGLEGDMDPELSNSKIIQTRVDKVRIFTETGVGANHDLDLADLPSAQAWHELAFTFDGGTVRYHLDGELVAMTAYEPAQTMATQMLVGGWWDGSEFIGLMDDLRIYDHPLTDAEARELTAQ